MRNSRAWRRLDLARLEDRITPVANDLFADAHVLTGTVAQVTNHQNFTTDPVTSAVLPFTGEPGEPNHAGVSTPLESAWYRWTAPITGKARVTLQETGSRQTALGVYTGNSVDALTAVGSKSGPAFATVEFDAAAGATYSFAVDSVGTGQRTYYLGVSVANPPANDAFAAPSVLDGAPVPATAAPRSSLALSTFEPGEPEHSWGKISGGSITAPYSVWYSWTPQISGQVIIDATTVNQFQSPFIGFNVFALAIYTGDAVDQLTKVANKATQVFLNSVGEVKLTLDAVAGTTYRIAFGGNGPIQPHTLDLAVINPNVSGVVESNGTVFVVGTSKNDTVRVTPEGKSATGFTGVRVRSTLGGQRDDHTFAGPITGAEFYLFDGNNTVALADSLAFPVVAEFGSGNDLFFGGQGNATVLLGDGNNLAITGAGTDTVRAGVGNDWVTTGGGADTISVGDGNNTIDAGDGKNTIDAGAGNDFVAGGVDRDVVRVGAGNNTVLAGDGDNLVTLGAGNDYVQTGSGKDTVNVAGGHNVVFCGAGNDTITAGFPSSTSGPLPEEKWSNYLDAGDGNDRVTVSSNGLSVVYAGAGDDDVTVGFLFVSGSTPVPPLSGRSIVRGGPGADVLIGGAGKDTFYGEDGKDILVGGLGTDVLVGGPGDDVLFDGVVRVAGGSPSSPPVLRPVFAAWNAADPTTYSAVRSKLVVTPDTASADVLTGGGGIDWFWSDDPLDLLDIDPVEVRN